MNAFFTIIKSDYLQRCRSYSFLITLCISLAIAYTFVPEPDAKYTTVQISNYVGYYNSAWFGYVTAMMTSLFLSLIGFFLINSTISNDVKTKVGQIIATTKIGNFQYLLSKALSNFLVLMTIVFIVFFMSIILFILYNDGYTFEFFQFLKPYVIITIPALSFISILAVVFEVFLGQYSIVQNILFFFLFSIVMTSSKNTNGNFYTDILGSKIVMHQLENEVREKVPTIEDVYTNIGFVFKNKKLSVNKFEFNGMEFPTSFIISRILWMLFGLGLLYISSVFFHRFNVKERINVKKEFKENVSTTVLKTNAINTSSKTEINYGIFSLIKTELLLLLRNGKKWLWLLNFGGMLLLSFIRIDITHTYILPLLWFLQVGRLSQLTTKEISSNVHYFAFASYRPLSRLLTSQILSAIILMLFLASPLLIRYAVSVNFNTFLAIILGAVFIVLLAVTLGIISNSKKLFEVLFFLITYTNINKIPFTDYFGSLSHSNFYLFNLIIGISLLTIVGFTYRRFILKRL